MNRQEVVEQFGESIVCRLDQAHRGREGRDLAFVFLYEDSKGALYRIASESGRYAVTLMAKKTGSLTAEEVPGAQQALAECTLVDIDPGTPEQINGLNHHWALNEKTKELNDEWKIAVTPGEPEGPPPRILAVDPDKSAPGPYAVTEKWTIEKPVPEGTAKQTDLRFSVSDRTGNGRYEHPKEAMRRLGITYATCRAVLSNHWIFYDCKNLPSLLPSYLSVADAVPRGRKNLRALCRIVQGMGKRNRYAVIGRLGGVRYEYRPLLQRRQRIALASLVSVSLTLVAVWWLVC